MSASSKKQFKHQSHPSVWILEESKPKAQADTHTGCALIQNCTDISPGGGTLIFSHIRRLGSFLGVQNFEFQYFLGFSKKIIFLGYEDFVDIFSGSSQNRTIFIGLFYAF